ncbi:MAG: formylglycine-generating enzyme family protein [Myxococcales bacterium]|nr:formylglycine-generating enzyme family protein [Myxococcales bacterium]
MRAWHRSALVAAVLAALLGGAHAGGRRGRLVRIEAPPPTRSWVAPGRFIMGTPPEDLETLQAECQRAQTLGSLFQVDPCVAWINVLSTRSPREVWLDGFWIDRHEVTVAEYRACVHAAGCPLEPLVDGDPRYLADDLPQVDVTRPEAETMCRWRGGRLPTEAEWEKAARGTDFRTWPWGDDPPHDLAELDEVLRQSDDNLRSLGDPDDSDGVELLARPGRSPASDGPYRTSDQAGNVAEWVADAMSVDGFIGLPDVNPLRLPDLGRDLAMVRGGSWRDPPFLGRTDIPHYMSMFMPPETRATHIGFRCVYGASLPVAVRAPITTTPRLP